MTRPIAAIIVSLVFLSNTGMSASVASDNRSSPMVKFQTSLGDILIELYPDDAPVTVENFVTYVESGFYDGTIFHRVIPGFVVQGGGMQPGMQQKSTREPITNEADNNLNNLAGTLSMARTNEPHSATSQFFINLKNNDFLDHRGKTPQGWGYAVFGKVVEGMSVVEKMAAVKTTSFGPYSDVPAEDIVLIKAEVVPD